MRRLLPAVLLLPMAAVGIVVGFAAVGFVIGYHWIDEQVMKYINQLERAKR